MGFVPYVVYWIIRSCSTIDEALEVVTDLNRIEEGRGRSTSLPDLCTSYQVRSTTVAGKTNKPTIYWLVFPRPLCSVLHTHTLQESPLAAHPHLVPGSRQALCSSSSESNHPWMLPLIVTRCRPFGKPYQTARLRRLCSRQRSSEACEPAKHDPKKTIAVSSRSSMTNYITNEPTSAGSPNHVEIIGRLWRRLRIDNVHEIWDASRSEVSKDRKCPRRPGLAGAAHALA